MITIYSGYTIFKAVRRNKRRFDYYREKDTARYLIERGYSIDPYTSMKDFRHLSKIGPRLTSGEGIIAKSPSSRNEIDEIIEEKKKRLIGVPSVSFHYVNKDQIKSYYNDYFREPTFESLVSEIAGEISGEIKGSIPKFVESKVGGRDLNKWISTLKFQDISLNGMFQRYQRETIKNSQVLLGIEEVDIELSELQEFEETINDLSSRFQMEIPHKLLEVQRTNLKEKAATKTLIKLEQATGWILVEGKYKVDEEGEYYKCTYSHPVNEYLSDQLGPVTISVIIKKDSLESHVAGNYSQSIGRSIPLRIYGQVWEPIDRKSNSWDFKITPLVIY